MLILFTEIIPVYYENQRKQRNGFCGEEMQSSCLKKDDSHNTHCASKRLCALSRNTNKMQLVTEFIIPKLIEGSTCFERHTAHHQEL
jgi:hypothetical protein